MVIHILAKALSWAFFSFFIKKTVTFSQYNYQMKSNTLHFSPPACLDLCSAACCTGEEERRKSELGHGGQRAMSAIRVVDQRPAQSFPSILPQSDQVSSIFPTCQSEPWASCLISVLYSGRGRGLHTGSSQSHGHPQLSLLWPCSPSCCLGWPWGASWQAATNWAGVWLIPVWSALEGGSCGCTFTACSSGYAFPVCSPWRSFVE